MRAAVGAQDERTAGPDKAWPRDVEQDLIRSACSIDRTRSGPARIAARTARAGRRREWRRVAVSPVGADREDRQQFLKIRAPARRAARRLAFAREKLELLAADAALV